MYDSGFIHCSPSFSLCKFEPEPVRRAQAEEAALEES
jgi:hypothetical protein